MRSLLILSALSLSLVACVDVHNPPPQQQQPAAVVVPGGSTSTTTTVICSPGTVC